MKLLKPTIIALLSLNLTQCAVVDHYTPDFVREKMEKNKREEYKKELDKILNSKRENHPNFPVDKFIEAPRKIYKRIDGIFKDTAIKFKQGSEKELYSAPKVDPNIPQYLNTICSHSVHYDPWVGRGEVTPNQCINPRYTQAVNARNNAINNINTKAEQTYQSLIKLYKAHADFAFNMCRYSWFSNDYSIMDKMLKEPIHDMNEIQAIYNRYSNSNITISDNEDRYISNLCRDGSANIDIDYFKHWMSQNIYEN